MRTADQIHVVLLEESRDHIGSERERDTSVIFTPAGDVLVGIGPQQVAKQSAIGNLIQSAKCPRTLLRAKSVGQAGKDVRQWVS